MNKDKIFDEFISDEMNRKYIYKMICNYLINDKVIKKNIDKDDIFQICSYKIYKGMMNFDISKASLKTYVTTIVKNELLELTRFYSRKQRCSEFENISLDANIDDGNCHEVVEIIGGKEDEYLKDDNVKLLINEIKKYLNDNHFQIFMLYLAKYKAKEISKVTGYSEASVRTIISKAKLKLEKKSNYFRELKMEYIG